MRIDGILTPVGAPTSADDSRVKAAAHEFEASLMKEFLKPLEHNSLFSEDKSGASEDEGSAGAVMSFGSAAMAKAISEHGGFRIATMILNHFHTHPAAVQDIPDRPLPQTGAELPATQVFRFPADKRT
jgi:peptidoglycan hydrolase FlgJ